MICLAAAGLLLGTANATRGQPMPATEPTTMAATQPSLRVGSVAPSLEVERWLEGEPVKRFEPGTVYVVDFWATWCGPCIASFPDLNALAAKYPKVVFIGVSIWETDQSKVAPFVERMGDRMRFRVAMDRPVEVKPDETPWGPVSVSWLRAAGHAGIPCWFIIGPDGRIAAINTGDLEEILPAVVNGTFDAAAHEARDARIMAVWPRLSPIINGKDVDAKLRAVDELEAIAPDQYVSWRVPLLIEKGELDAAQRLFDQKVDRPPETLSKHARINVERLRMELSIAHHDRVGVERDLTTLAKLWDDNPTMLNALAWACVADSLPLPGIRELKVDPGLALRIAEQAVAASDGTDPEILDTLARVHAACGDYAKAIEVETRALQLNPTEKDRPLFEQALANYRAGKVE